MLDTSSRFSAGQIALLDLAQHIGLRTLDDAARAFDLNARLARAWVTTTTDRLSAALPCPPAAGAGQVAAGSEADAAAAPTEPAIQDVAPSQPLQAVDLGPAFEPTLATHVAGLDQDRPSPSDGVHLPASLAAQPPIVQAVHDAVEQAAQPAAPDTAAMTAAVAAVGPAAAAAAAPGIAAAPAVAAKPARGAKPASARGRGVRSTARGSSGNA